jgi:tetratricopeptide (TPR) repeat protein
MVLSLLLLAARGGLTAQALPVSGDAAFGEIRQALVIGNSKHPVKFLPNPVNDARAMEKALKNLGFEVTLLTDGTQADMNREISKFVLGIKKESVALIYYAGHGVEIDGTNYLIPSDLAPRDVYDLQARAINVGTVMAELGVSSARIRVMILDACRDNPYPLPRTRSLTPSGFGLGKGVYYAFSTAPGGLALDKSVFTESLVAELDQKQPGTTVEEIFNHVRARVMDLTNDDQVPYATTGLKGTWYPFGPPTLPDPSEYEIHRSAEDVENAIRLIAKGQYDEALRALDAAIHENWRNSPAYEYRGILRGIEGKHAEELSDFSAAIRFDPANFGAYLNRGLARKNGGDCSGADEDFDKAAVGLPDTADIYKYRAWCETEIGQPAEANEDLQKYFSLNGGKP